MEKECSKVVAGQQQQQPTTIITTATGAHRLTSGNPGPYLETERMRKSFHLSTRMKGSFFLRITYPTNLPILAQVTTKFAKAE